jgi:hypothetical protein
MGRKSQDGNRFKPYDFITCDEFLEALTHRVGGLVLVGMPTLLTHTVTADVI